MQLSNVSAIFDTKNNILCSCLKKEVWHRLLLRKKIKIMNGLNFCTEKFMLIPINWVPTSYIVKVSPSHLMVSPPLQKIIVFFRCCCFSFSANAGYLKSYFEITGFKVCKLSDAYFSSLWPKGREKKPQ